MIMHDHNGNGKDDLFDKAVDYEILFGDEKKNDKKPDEKPEDHVWTGGGSGIAGAVILLVCFVLFIIGIIIF